MYVRTVHVEIDGINDLGGPGGWASGAWGGRVYGVPKMNEDETVTKLRGIKEGKIEREKRLILVKHRMNKFGVTLK